MKYGVHHLAHWSPPLGPILSEMEPVHIIPILGSI
jgi:hypothetical protein